ncbi:MAG: hypothetical protein R3F11_03295 [Verrucomicrobiales bacterium]
MAAPIVHLIGEGLSVPLAIATFVLSTAGVAMIFLGLRFRIWVLPYRFTVDRDLMIAGYRWKESWAGRIDLGNLRSLTLARCTYPRGICGWVIYANTGDRRQTMFSPSMNFDSELAASEHGKAAAEKIAAFLAVPVEFEEWVIAPDAAPR